MTSIPSKKPSLADTPREDGKEWKITRLKPISKLEKDKIRKKLPKF